MTSTSSLSKPTSLSSSMTAFHSRHPWPRTSEQTTGPQGPVARCYQRTSRLDRPRYRTSYLHVGWPFTCTSALPGGQPGLAAAGGGGGLAAAGAGGGACGGGGGGGGVAGLIVAGAGAAGGGEGGGGAAGLIVAGAGAAGGEAGGGG